MELGKNAQLDVIICNILGFWLVVGFIVLIILFKKIDYSQLASQLASYTWTIGVGEL